MISWPEFERVAPAIAAAGRRLMHRFDRGEVALLATVDRAGRPRMAPVCPIFTETGLFLLTGLRTPKTAHLDRSGHYALHAQVGADDTEFQISGAARRVEDSAARQAVLDAIPFTQFDPRDPIFELRIACGLLVRWPEPGRREITRWRDDGC